MLKKITIAGMAVMLTATPLMELSRIRPIGNIGYAEAAPKVKDKNVTVSNVEITSIKGAVTKENPVAYDKPINVSFTMNIDNSLKNLKAGAKTTLEITTFTERPQEVNLNSVTFTANLVGSDGVTYGTYTIKKITTTKTEFIITWNSNIEKVSNAKSSMTIKELARITDYNDPKGGDTEFTFGFLGEDIQLWARGASLREYLPTINGGGGFSTKMAEIAGGNRVYNGVQYYLGRGQTEEFKGYKDIKQSYWIPGDVENVYASVTTMLYSPQERDGSNENISTQYMAHEPLTKLFTLVKQNEGETWKDFRDRVQSKRLQYGLYKSSEGVGAAFSLGDYTENGWENGKAILGETSGKPLDKMIDDSVVVTDAQKAVAKKIYGKGNRMKGAVPAVTPNITAKFKMAAAPYVSNVISEQSAIDSTGKIVSNTGKASLTVNFPEVELEKTDGTINGLVQDGDTHSLLKGVKAKLSKFDNSGWTTVKELSSDDKGLFSQPNLAPGTYRLGITPPAGYSDKIKMSIDNTVLTGNEFTLTESSGVSLEITLYKKTTQDVNFTDKDGFNRPVAGGVYGLYTSKGALVMDNLTVGKDGTMSIKSLPSGEYYLLQKSAPSTHYVTKEKLNFTVNKGEDGPLNVSIHTKVKPVVTSITVAPIALGDVAPFSSQTIRLNVSIKYTSEEPLLMTIGKVKTDDFEFAGLTKEIPKGFTGVSYEGLQINVKFTGKPGTKIVKDIPITVSEK